MIEFFWMVFENFNNFHSLNDFLNNSISKARFFKEIWGRLERARHRSIGVAEPDRLVMFSRVFGDRLVMFSISMGVPPFLKGTPLRKSPKSRILSKTKCSGNHFFLLNIRWCSTASSPMFCFPPDGLRQRLHRRCTACSPTVFCVLRMVFCVSRWCSASFVLFWLCGGVGCRSPSGSTIHRPLSPVAQGAGGPWIE